MQHHEPVRAPPTVVGIEHGAQQRSLLALINRAALAPGQHMKLLELGSVVLFSGLGAWALNAGTDNWSVLGVRLAVDIGLCPIVAISLLLDRPFTLPYAKKRVTQGCLGDSAFPRVNRVLSPAWLAAFAALAAADARMPSYVQAVPLAVGIGLLIAGPAGVSRFSRLYPKQIVLTATCAPKNFCATVADFADHKSPQRWMWEAEGSGWGSDLKAAWCFRKVF